MSEKKIKNLVVDTTAFIKCGQLQEFADNVFTIQEVVDEITSKRQLRRLVVLPYDIKIKDVFLENIKFVTEFSKKTGDYTSLSATDIKVIALTYQLEKEKSGTDHLKNEPTMQRTIKISTFGKQIENTISENPNTNTNEKASEETTQDESVMEQLSNLDLETSCENDDLLVEANSEENTSDEDEDSDGGEWITPSNVKEKKRELEMGEYEDQKLAEVACMTSDFAMQNVMKQIGLNITSIDGRIIKQVRTFIFRCTTCFKLTSDMTKAFCPKCGHATLRKVGVTVDGDGNQRIHINGKKPLTARGKKFSLPTPKGGQHFQYPIVTADQHVRNRKATRLARQKNNPLDPDYVAGYSPFIMRDVNSKSAVLGVRADKEDMKYWMKHSANQTRNKRK